MADKILKIILEVDTTATDKLVTVVTKQVESLSKLSAGSERLKFLERERLALAKQQEAAIAQSAAKMQQLQTLQESGALKLSLALHLANKEAVSLGNTLDVLVSKQRNISSNGALAGQLFSGLTNSASKPDNISPAPLGVATRNPLTGSPILEQSLALQDSIVGRQQIQIALAEKRLQREQAITNELQRQHLQEIKSTTRAPENSGAAEARQLALRQERIALESALEAANAEKIARFNEGMARSSNAIIEQQTKTHLAEQARLARQAAENSKTFAQRIGSTGVNKTDIIGTLDRAKAAPQAASQAANLNQTTTALVNHENAVTNLNTKHKSLVAHISEVVGIYRVLTATINLTQQALLNIPKAGIAQQANKAGIFAIFGSEEGIKNLKFIEELAGTAGQVISDLEQSYSKFAPSAKLAGATQAEINQSFKDFTEVATILNLSKDKVDSVFLALDQIFSKGVVQSEEIKKQLGNALPGAVEIGALAMGKSNADFLEAMKNNQVIAKDFVPKFAALYREIFGGVDDSVFNENATKLLSNLHRIETAYIQFNRAAFVDLEGSLNIGAKAIAASVETVTEHLQGLQQVVKITADIIISRLVISAFLSLPTAIAGTILAIDKLGFALVGLRTPQLLAIGLWTAAIAKLAHLETTYEEHRGFVTKLGGQYVSTSILIEKTFIITIQKIGALLKTLNNFKITSLFDYSSDRDLSGKFFADYEANLKEFAGNSGNIVTEAIAADTEKLLESFKAYGKTALDVQEAVKQGLLKSDAEITAALNNLREIPAPDQVNVFENTESALDKLNKQKEAGFAREKKHRDEIQKQLDLQFERERDIIDLKRSQFENEVTRRSHTDNPITQKDIITKNAALERQEKTAQVSYLEQQASAGSRYQRVLQATKTELIELQALQNIESSGNKNAISGDGAVGKFQILPSTFANPGIGNLPDTPIKQVVLDAQKAYQNKTNTKKHEATLREFMVQRDAEILDNSKAYFLTLKDEFDGNTIRAVAAYNAGIGKERKGIRPDETVNHVAKFKKEFARLNAEQAQAQPVNPEAITNKENLDEEAVTNVESKRIAVEKLGNAISIVNDVEATKIDTLGFEVKQAERRFEIEELSLAGRSKDAALAEVTLEFEQRRRDAVSLGSEFLKRRLPILEKEKKYEIEITDIKEKYQQEETRYQNNLQEIANKALLGQTNSTKAVEATIALQIEHSAIQDAQIDKWKEIAALSANVKDNVEAQLAAQQELARKQQNAALLGQGLAPAKDQLDSTLAQVGSSKTDALALAQSQYEQDLRDKKLTAEQEYQDAVGNIEQQAFLKKGIAQTAYYEASFTVGANSFLALTKASAAMYGEQSKQAKVAFVAYKAFKIAETVMATAKGAMEAYASLATIPYVGPFLGAAAAAAVIAAGAIQVGIITNESVAAAHGGLSNVPAEQTYLLDKGERVLSPNQNRDFTDDLRSRREEKQNQQAAINNIRIINVADESMVYSALGSDQGEQVIMNIVNRNR